MSKLHKKADVMSAKIIVSNKEALTKKYGPQGLAAIEEGVKKLVAADKARSIATRLLYLDDGSAMKKIGGTAVTAILSPRQNKNAIDAIFKKLEPAYLMILGAPDVVPHQHLADPLQGTDSDDEDNGLPGDLAYACDAAYSTDIAAFVGPTRVVGRLPDLVRAKDPAYLLELLKTAAEWTSRPAKSYAKFFGLSTHDWRGSTEISLENIFGNPHGLQISPVKGPAHTAVTLKPLMHFINCHGWSDSPSFLGQKGEDYPVSLTSAAINKKIAKGTVAAVECCYGAQLYDAVTMGLDLPICQNYLRHKAYGYFGSTTIAYGPPDENGAADFICQYFLIEVLKGASIGCAALVARQRYIEQTSQMDPIDLKTLGQFCLLGDPSIQPVIAAKAAPGAKSASAAGDDKSFARAELRAKLRVAGAVLAMTKPTASKVITGGSVPAKAKADLEKIAQAAGLRGKKSVRAYAVKVKSSFAGNGKGAKAVSLPTRYLVAVGKPPASGRTPQKVMTGVAVVAKEVNGTIVGHRIYHQR